MSALIECATRAIRRSEPVPRCLTDQLTGPKVAARVSGVDLTRIDGIDVTTALAVISATGTADCRVKRLHRV